MVVNIFIFIAGFFISVFLLGRIFEKFRIPWIFSALFIGGILAWNNPFEGITTSPEFAFLAQLGMLFLLFVIGFEIDLREMKNLAGFIVKSTFFIIIFEAVFGSALIHFLFGYDWIISGIIGLSFATVGEAILIPILDEFKIVNTKLGQSIMGIGTFDDIFEISVLVFVSFILGEKSGLAIGADILKIALSIAALLLLTFLFVRFRKESTRFKFYNIETLFLFSLFVLFLFLGVGNYADSSALAALLAGISLNSFVPKERVKLIKNEVKSMCYGFFAPLFFLSAGLALNLNYLFTSFALVILVFLVSGTSKIVASYIMGKNYLGVKNSMLLGVGLSVRFSTSIVIIKILLDHGIIREGLYSVILASSILFTIVVPVVFSYLVSKYRVKR